MRFFVAPPGMDLRYAAWIAKNVPADPTGKCAEITEQMATAFPELKRVRGHYTGAGLLKPWPHWWLVTPEDEIVDPTASQWPDDGRGLYEPHDEAGQEPTGKCLDCGEYVYGSSRFCNATCEASTLAYLNEGRL